MARTHQEILALKIDPNYDPVSRLADLPLPDLVRSFLSRALAFHPRDRFHQSASFREALEHRAADLPDLMVHAPVCRPGWLIDAFFAVATFGFFAFLGYSADAPRFYLYGLVMGATMLIQFSLRGDMRLVAQMPILFAGLVMVAGGVFTLVSFLKQYPPVDLGASNG